MNIDPAEIKVTSTFNLPLLTKQQLAELKYRTGKDMGEIISDLVANEHARFTGNSPISERPLFPLGSSPIVGG